MLAWLVCVVCVCGGEGDKTQKNKSYKIITDYPNMLTNTAWDERDALGKENVCMLYCRVETKLSLPLITRKVLVFVLWEVPPILK